MSRLLSAVIAGLIAFAVTYIVILILAAILNALTLVDAASVLRGLGWILAVLAGLLVGWNRYVSGVSRL